MLSSHGLHFSDSLPPPLPLHAKPYKVFPDLIDICLIHSLVTSFQSEKFTRRRSVQFVAIPTTVVVPGSEEKEHRSGGGEGPAVRVKEIHPGKPASLNLM